MKKLTIISLGFVLLFSCSGSTSELEATRNTRDGIIPFGAAVHFKYKNHQYIKFTEGNGNYKAVGVVHDPDCKYCKR